MKSKNLELVLDVEALKPQFGLPFVKRISVVRSHSADRISWHSHPCYEVLMLVDGATAYEFKESSVAELSGGQFLVVPPRVFHRGLNDVRKPALLCGLMIGIDELDADSPSPFSRTDREWIAEQLASAALQPRKMSLELQQLVKKIPSLVTDFDPSSRMSLARTRIRLCEIVLEIALQLDSVDSLETTYLVRAAISCMEEQLASPTSISDLAKRVGCSRAKLFEIFKKSTGLTPNDYWQRLRIEHAYQHVLTTNDSITTIAMQFGFSSSQYFCTVFRKYFGFSPRDCRRGIVNSPLAVVVRSPHDLTKPFSSVSNGGETYVGG